MIGGLALLGTAAFGQNGITAKKAGNLEEGLHVYTNWADKNWNRKADAGEFDNFDKESYSYDRRKDLKFYLHDKDLKIGVQTRCLYTVTDKETGEVVLNNEMVLFNGELNHIIGPMGSSQIFKPGKTYEVRIGDFKQKKNQGKEYFLEYKLE